ncbi:MAG: AmmeMemoRadiSam system protein B [Planctomycetes bacterium]|nr:AmmeMemoRadiSam system protein B [Planctomycetota bacterium]MCB9919889.1 AmmeMemoRadiSam system protein B [Planctomycetota bacterium]
MTTAGRPRLRALELRESVDPSMRGVLLSDPEGLLRATVFVPHGLMPVLALFDGQRTCDEIAELLERQFGQPVAASDVLRIAADLDQRLCLEGERVESRRERERREFAELAVRPLRHAGSGGYPADPSACRERLEEVLRSWRPEDPAFAGSRLLGLVAPHIDLKRGEAGYASAYGALAADPEPAEIVVVFGTGHRGPSSLLVPTTKRFATPWGDVDCDRDFLERVRSRLTSNDPKSLVAWESDELLHRDEHSLEFQVLFLRHVLRDRRPDFRIVPFLTGESPAKESTRSQAHVDAILETCREFGPSRVTFVAGADLAHVGPFFGDPALVDDASLEQVRAADLSSLAVVCAGDAAGFLQEIEADGNARRVCGTTPVWFVSKLVGALGGQGGRTLHYGQAVAEDRSQCVTFAALAFDRPRIAV